MTTLQRFQALVAGWSLIPVEWLLGEMERVRPAGENAGSVGSHFLARPRRVPNVRVIREDAALSVAAVLLTRLAIWISADERRAARRAFRTLFAQMERDREYRQLPRVVGIFGATFRAGRFDPHHFYSYRPPPQHDGETFGVFVFLHGHGPNALILLHALRPLADIMRMVVVAPSFGYGNWEASGGIVAIERAVDFALAAFPVEPARVYLAGLSQGGAGVTRAAAAAPDRFAGLVFLSGVLERSVCESEAFVAGWHGKPVLVVHGERDHNVKFRCVAESVEVMTSAGVVVTRNYHPESDHLLFFARRDEILRQIASWMRNRQ